MKKINYCYVSIKVFILFKANVGNISTKLSQLFFVILKIIFYYHVSFIS